MPKYTYIKSLLGAHRLYPHLTPANARGPAAGFRDCVSNYAQAGV